MKTKLGVAVTVIVLLLTTLYLTLPNAFLAKYLIAIDRHIAGMSKHKLKLDELDIAYLRGGSGEPLILLHGFGADKDNWNKVSYYLTDYYDVIAVDIPGFGDSTRSPTLNYDVTSQIERVKGILVALNIDNAHFAGSSMGGYIAGNFAAQYPQQVKSLWLISPFGVTGTQKSDMELAIEQGQQPTILPRTQQEFNQLFESLFVTPPFIPQPIIDHLATKAIAAIPLNNKIYQQIHRIKHHQIHPDLPLNQTLLGYQSSVLISWGTEDKILHVSGAKALHQAMPQAQIQIIKDAGHLPMMEMPAQSARAYLSFTAAQ
ncbi:alpha/beta fold hydrolase [Shewanella waksmanii]|uniref:alpha/beta fold hydrolase n=1 Tax=Shewanella waksmanii TaxID=213783 RepID=UPI003735271D